MHAFFSCPFWPNMEISKVKLFSDSRPARKHLLGRRMRHCLFFQLETIDCQQSRGFDCNKEMWGVFATRLFDPCAWWLLSPGGWTNRGCHFERWSCHIRGGWCFYTESLDVFNILSSYKSMRFERCLWLFNRIQEKDCNTMTRSSQTFDMDYGIGHDFIAFWCFGTFPVTWCWNVLAMKTDGDENVRAEGLSIWVSLFLMSLLFAILGGCIMHDLAFLW